MQSDMIDPGRPDTGARREPEPGRMRASGGDGGSGRAAVATALLQAVRRGCHASFARLYALTRGDLIQIVLALDHGRDEAEDVLQEIYANVWTRCAQFDARRGHAGSWLAGLARNAAIDSLRRRHARPRRGPAPVADEDDPYAGLASPDPQPLDIALRVRDTAAVRRGLRLLAPAHRECLTLAFYEGLSYSEIAGRVGRPLGTVKTWQRRSFSAMRAGLAGHR